MAAPMSLVEHACRLSIVIAYAEWFLARHKGIVTEDFVAYERALGLEPPF